MTFVRIDTQGESKVAIVNTEQITYLTEGIYGATIHFDSGEYLVCAGDLAEMSQKLFGSAAADSGSFMLMKMPEGG